MTTTRAASRTCSRLCAVALALWLLPASGQIAAPPPPRTVDDVLAVLEQYRPDPQAVARLKVEAAAQPPAGAGPQELALFYHRRARANTELGDLTQEIADLERALQSVNPSSLLTGPSGLGERRAILQELRAAEVRNGNNPRVIELAHATIRQAPDSGAALFGWTNIISSSLRLGDLAAARQALSELESSVRNTRRWRDWAAWQHNVLLADDIGHALLLDASGNPQEGERRWRSALAHAEADALANEQRIRSGRGSIPQATAIRSWSGSEMDLAAALRVQGRLAEAESYARSALIRRLKAFGRYNTASADAIRVLAAIVYESGRYAEARKLAQAATDTFLTAGAFPGSSRVADAKAIVGASLVAQAQFADAAAVFEARDRDLQTDSAQAARLQSRLDANWGYALLRTGKVQAARDMFDGIYSQRRKLGRTDTDYGTAQARGLRGLALAAAGENALALADLRAALPALIEQDRQGSDGEQAGIARQLRLSWILEGYLQLLWQLRDSALLRNAGIDAASEAFRIADFARGSRVQRALAASAARSNLGDPALAELANREQSAMQRMQTLNDLVNRLLAAPPERQLSGVIEAMRKDIAALRTERDKLKDELLKRYPDYASLIDPRPAAIDQVRRVLAPEEAVLSVYLSDHRAWIWAFRHDGPVVFASVETGDAEIAGVVAALRKPLDSDTGSLTALMPFDTLAARRLHDLILQPVEAGWRGARALLVVPHKSLAQFPFALMVTGEASLAAGKNRFEEYRDVPWLLRQTAIVQLPTAHTLITMRRVQPVRGERKPFIGFGDPVFDSGQAAVPRRDGSETRGVARRNLSIATVSAAEPNTVPGQPAPAVANSSRLAQLAPLPDTAEEIESIARALGAQDTDSVFLGKSASERNVKSGALRQRRIVAFATHGLVPGDLDGLTQPALALSAPDKPADAGDDGLLTLEEVLGLRLDADWVVLSACNTASNDGSGSEAISGLGRGFFFAGARSLLVSNWPVETVSARLLTTDLFERQAKDASLTRAEALRRTMLAMLDGMEARDGAQVRYTYAHPLFWAPFTLVGDGGR